MEQDKKLWAVFKQRYLEASRLFTNSVTPARFIAAIEAKCSKASIQRLF
jgi:hypothetical protein